MKLHPYENDHNEQEIAKKIDSSIVVVKKRNLLSLIQSSDVVILLGTSISTAVLDAIILNKPVMRLPFGEWYGDYGDGSCINIEKNEFKEKLKDNPLIGYARNHDNLIITPHYGGATIDAWVKTEKKTLELILEYFAT